MIPSRMFKYLLNICKRSIVIIFADGGVPVSSKVQTPSLLPIAFPEALAERQPSPFIGRCSSQYQLCQFATNIPIIYIARQYKMLPLLPEVHKSIFPTNNQTHFSPLQCHTLKPHQQNKRGWTPYENQQDRFVWLPPSVFCIAALAPVPTIRYNTIRCTGLRDTHQFGPEIRFRPRSRSNLNAAFDMFMVIISF